MIYSTTGQGEGQMKSTIHTYLSAGIVFLAFCCLLPTSVAAENVCGSGTGLPPFLSSGADANLLLVLDNSGSMLDMVYNDNDDNTHCFDDTYDTTETYGGYFGKSNWYKWSNGSYPTWEDNKAYATGARVYEYGIIWVATETETSNGSGPDNDQGVYWEHLFTINKWTNDTEYDPGSFVWSGPQLYYTASGGISNDPDITDGVSLSDDIGFNSAQDPQWVAVDSTWRNGIAYSQGDIVTYKGTLYEVDAAGDAGTSSGTSVHDDVNVNWTRLNEGRFEEIAKDVALTYCSTATGTDKHVKDTDLCISLDLPDTPTQVTAFAARGNFLNWTMVSKLDVEKKILTGGKYDYYNQQLIGEHRGCSGARSVRQVQLDDGKYLGLGVRGSKHETDPMMEDRIDSTDDTGRLEVLAITDDSYELSVECSLLIEDILKGISGANISNGIRSCYGSMSGDTMLVDMNPILNQGLQVCHEISQGEMNLGHFDGLVGDCERIYTASGTGVMATARPYLPTELIPTDGGPFICYGVPDLARDHNNRIGYMGRCWSIGGTGGTRTCVAMGSLSLANGGCDGDPCTFMYGVELYKNENNYLYHCETLKSDGISCQNDGDYVQLWRWDDSTDLSPDFCSVDDVSSGAGDAGWEVATWADDRFEPPVPGNCLFEAIKDYCNDLMIPEVIDPSEAADITTEFGNLPGLVMDSHLLSFLGGSEPIAVMKGHVDENTRPEGVLHSVAHQLNLGVMAFHYVGAATECEPENLTPGVSKYCPKENYDGAELLAEIKAGTLIVDTADTTYPGNERRHVDDLAQAINDIRASSWTPLGEAVYSALGYYTQNENFIINKDENGDCITDDNGDCIDFPTDDDPIKFWCQDNHILVISEGESTADINAEVAAFTDDSSTHYLNWETGDNDDGDSDTDAVCTTSDLFSSTYFDDMTWWGRHVKPLYKDRILYDPDGNPHEKQIISTHVVTTSELSTDGTGECSPETLMKGAAANGGTALLAGSSPEELEANLRAALADILSRASAGSAASVISSSRSGSGAVYQAIFWPSLTDNDENTVDWVGDVHAMFMSSDGHMYEDTNQDGILDEGADRMVMFYFSSEEDENTAGVAGVNKSRGCYNADVAVCLANEPKKGEGACNPDGGDDCVEITNILYLWSANDRLRTIDSREKRKLLTWNDANNDGIVDTGEFFDLNDATAASWEDLNTIAALPTTTPPRGPVTYDFLTPDDWDSIIIEGLTVPADVESDAMQGLVRWLNGTDQMSDDETGITGIFARELRSRQYDFEGDGLDVLGKDTWKLGDIIHSTPIAVSKPAEAYHYIYRDRSYQKFYMRWLKRRNVIYFGGNDGMMHAINGGYYSEEDNQFYCGKDDSGYLASDDGTNKCHDAIENNQYALGDEMWAYIPYNLQPHLKCLTKTGQPHKYYVDQKPRIFDAQIFKEDPECSSDLYHDDCIHAGGWGTILVGSMGLGGAPVLAEDLNGLDGQDGRDHDQREFTSSFFVLDITKPDDPKLLGEMTRTTELLSDGTPKYLDLNYTTSSPSMVIMRHCFDNNTPCGDIRSAWYLVMGNGPTDLDGSNEHGEQARIAVLPLEWLGGKLSNWGSDGIASTMFPFSGRGFRILNKRPDGGTNISTDSGEGGVFLVEYDTVGNPGFVGDIITVDFDIGLSSNTNSGSYYKADAVYFGTTDGSGFVPYPAPKEDEKYWNGGGRLFRLVTRLLDTGNILDLNNREVNSKPSMWASGWADNDPMQMLLDAQAPISAAPSVAYDGDSYWVYSGAGRFYDKGDKTDDGRPGWDKTDYADEDPSDNDNGKISFFAIKEPMSDSRASTAFDAWSSTYRPTTGSLGCLDSIMTWEAIDWDINADTNQVDLNHNGIPGKRGLMQVDNITVALATSSQYDDELSYLECVHCVDNDQNYFNPICETRSNCFPSDLPTTTVTDEFSIATELHTFTQLREFIAGTGCIETDETTGLAVDATTGLDGWYRDYHERRERNLGQAALLGGLVTFTGYMPSRDICVPEGMSFLYGVHYQTGTAWMYDVFGIYSNNTDNAGEAFVMDKVSLGTGVTTTPSMHVGTGSEGASVFIQTSTGEIREVKQDNLPINNTKTGRSSWTDRCGTP